MTTMTQTAHPSAFFLQALPIGKTYDQPLHPISGKTQAADYSPTRKYTLMIKKRLKKR